MADKGTVATTAVGTGTGGIVIGNLMDGEFRDEVFLWLKDEVGAYSVILLILLLLMAYAQYLVFKYFANRDKEKRLDTKEGWGEIAKIRDKVSDAIDRNTESNNKVLVALAYGGLNVQGATKPAIDKPAAKKPFGT